ncbi:C-terminal binding protein [Faecalicoccus sp. LCP19S3_E3]|uniref:C-terminal binding protein n=1 Tax=unclassified Faecalicoccus TaxID=2643311 RepID=UPI0025E0420D|nr:C-terminal binding protein [uncultured Faecalicoccus sp.]
MKVIITDCDHENINIEKEIFDRAGICVELKQAITEDEVIEQCQGADVFIVQYAKITEKVMDHCPQLKYVVRYGVGLDTIDIPAATKHGILVGNVPDYGMNEVADHAIALSLSMLRKIVEMNEYTKEEKWDYTKAIPVHRFSQLTCGVVGLGRIGRNFAKKMNALGFYVIGYDPYFKPDEETDLYVKSVPFEDVVQQSDIISIHCPADGNMNLFNEKVFKKMKDTAILINVARGGIINEKDLEKALSDHQIGGACLDCMLGEPVDKDSPLFKFDNVIVTPHMAWYSEEASQELKRKVAEESVRFLRGEPIHYPANKVIGVIR